MMAASPTNSAGTTAQTSPVLLNQNNGNADQYSGLVDNRCCFCLTLRTGAIITGVLNGIINVALFTAYVTSATVKSSWGHPGESVTNLDISYLVVFTLQIVCDAILVWGAMKKIPNHLVPWLWANAVIIAVFLVFIALMLFFGHLRTTMNHNEFITTLAGIGILGGIHMFSWLVVFQFRRNLVEEMRIMARLVASAPPPPSDELPPLREERAPSPPPAYDEVTKSQKPTEQNDGISTSDVKIDMGNESPPEYAAAIAMSATQNATQEPVILALEMDKGNQ